VIEDKGGKRPSNAKGELDANVDITRLLDNLRELHGLCGGVLQVVDGEDLEAGVVDLDKS